MRLYELTGQYLELQRMAEEEQMDQRTIADTLEGLDGEIEEKADAYAKIMCSLDGNVESIKKEIARLENKKNVLINNKDALKRNLESAMLVMGKTKFKTELFSFGIQKNPPSLEILDETKIPEGYWIPQEPKLDRKKLLADVKADQKGAAAYAALRQTESLRIR